MPHLHWAPRLSVALFSGFSLNNLSLVALTIVKNTIMVVDFALDGERKEDKPPHEAVHRVCLRRLRPIMMTTMAPLPLMLRSGTSSEFRHPFRVTIVRGPIVSQLLTLFTTPVIHLDFDRLGGLIRQSLGGGEVKSGGAAG